MTQDHAIDWKQGTPISRLYDDPFFSLENGLAETRHTFLQGNALPERFAPGFHIAELGFGTGLNMLVALKAWIQSGVTGPLRFTSFEAHPLTAEQMRTALSAFPEVASLADPFLQTWGDGKTRFVSNNLLAEVVIGDASESLQHWQPKADAWFLDGFSPAKNPELWQEDLMQNVASHTAPKGTFATYTAAGHVRRALETAGFEVQRIPGFGRKRHMSCGVLR